MAQNRIEIFAVSIKFQDGSGCRANEDIGMINKGKLIQVAVKWSNILLSQKDPLF